MALSNTLALNESTIGATFSTSDDLIDHPELTTPEGWEIAVVRGVTVAVTAVSVASATSVLLTLGSRMTRGTSYTVTATALAESDVLIASTSATAISTVAESSDSRSVDITFTLPMLAASAYPVGVTGPQDEEMYSIAYDSDDYVLDPSISDIVLASTSTQVGVVGLTTKDYLFSIAPTTLKANYPDATLATLEGIGGGLAEQDSLNDRWDIRTVGMSNFIFYQPYNNIASDSSLSFSWEFETADDQVLPNAINPQQLLTFIVSDGLKDLRVAMASIDLGATPVIHVYTGMSMTLLHTEEYDWTDGRCAVEVLRNIKGQFYCVFINDTPIHTGPLSDWANSNVNAGGRIEFRGQSAVEVHAYLYSFSAYAGDPLYSYNWDPIWSHVTPFTGVGGCVTRVVKTAKGPLVKPWGDYTLATKNDVVVTAGEYTLPVSDINPYTGDITLETPWPRTVTVDSATVTYSWIEQPLLTATKLNTPGIVLNKYDRDYHHLDAPVSSSPNPSRLGTAKTSRFRYGVVLSPSTQQATVAQPVSYGKRFRAFQKGYAALLNHSPSLLLNQSPFKHAPTFMRQEVETQSLSFEGKGLPNSDWSFVGTGTSATDSIDTFTLTGEGYYTSPVTIENADFSVRMAYRHSVGTLSATDSVFTGVMAGFKDHRRVYVLGDLSVNGVHHIGVLQDETTPTILGGWDVLYPLTLSLRSSTSASVSGLSVQAKAGDRFQIFTGSQSGVYTIASIVRGLTSTTVTITETFPANYKLYGNRDVVGYGEIPDNITISLLVSENRTTVVRYLGLEQTTTANVENFQDIPTASLFFGHANSGSSTWKFVRAAFVGPLSEVTTGAFTNDYLNGSLLWEEGGRSHVLSNTVVTSDITYISSPETFYTPKAVVDARWDFTVIDPVTQLTMSDGTRDIILAPFLYIEQDGVRSRTVMGRTTQSDMTLSEGTLVLSNEDVTSVSSASDGGVWLDATLTPNPDVTDLGSRIISIVFRGSYLDIRFSFGTTFQDARIMVDTVSDTYTLYSGYPATVQSNGPGVGFSATDWNWLRVTVDPSGNFVSTLNSSIISFVSASSFGTTLSAHRQFSIGTEQNSATLDFKSVVFSQDWSHPDVYSTLGIRRRTNAATSIDGWELPRTDASSASNSSLSGPVIEPVDITSVQDLRLRYDPQWGVTLYIIRKGPSPFYVDADTSFFDNITEPSAGWINLAYTMLPRKSTSTTFGSVSLQGFSLSSSLYYRLFVPSANRALPDNRQNMILNRGLILTSGEPRKDQTPEVKMASVLTSTIATLRATDYYASRIFRIVDGSETYTGNDVLLSADGQTITLLPNPTTQAPRTWISDVVAVTFAVTKPSESYLQNETVRSSRQFNEGVPLYEYAVYTGDSYRIITTANALQPWADDDESRLFDLTRQIEFVDPDNVHYLAMQQSVVDDGGVQGIISFPRKDSDLRLGIGGSSFYETSEGVDPDAESSWLHDGPLFSPMFLGGGGYLGSTVEDGITITWGTQSLGGLLGGSVFLPTEGSSGLVSVYDVTLSESDVITDSVSESDFSADLA